MKPPPQNPPQPDASPADAEHLMALSHLLGFSAPRANEATALAATRAARLQKAAERITEGAAHPLRPGPPLKLKKRGGPS